MSFGLGRGRALDDAPGVVGIASHELGPLPDDLTSAEAARIDPRTWFPDLGSLEIEIGCGKGAFLLQEGATRPGTNFLGIEHAREFYLYAADRVRRRGLRNVRILHADAGDFVRWRVPQGVVSVVHLYFPDPWPKARHHKNRLIQDRFLGEAARILVRGTGELRIVTDHDAYWEWIEEHAGRWAGPSGSFVRFPFRSPDSAGEGELVGSNFERKYRREGRPFHGLILRRRGGA